MGISMPLELICGEISILLNVKVHAKKLFWWNSTVALLIRRVKSFQFTNQDECTFISSCLVPSLVRLPWCCLLVERLFLDGIQTGAILKSTIESLTHPPIVGPSTAWDQGYFCAFAIRSNWALKYPETHFLKEPQTQRVWLELWTLFSIQSASLWGLNCKSGFRRTS